MKILDNTDDPKLIKKYGKKWEKLMDEDIQEIEDFNEVFTYEYYKEQADLSQRYEEEDFARFGLIFFFVGLSLILFGVYLQWLNEISNI